MIILAGIAGGFVGEEPWRGVWVSSQAEKRMAGNNEKHHTACPFHFLQVRITKLPAMQDVIILKLPI